MELDIDFNLSIIIASLALIATVFSVRYQIITMINAQMTEKAKECNNNLDENNSLDEGSTSKISGVVSAIITAKQLLNLQLRCKKKHILLLLRKQYFIDQFYLQLHTSIRVWIDINQMDQKDTSQILQNQKESSFKFLEQSIDKDRKGLFQ